MSKSVFNKKLPRSCEYCIHSEQLQYEREIICKKHGVTDYRDFCRSYKYDPLKRTPIKPKISDNYSPDDFKL